MVVSREPSLLRPLWSIGESNAWHVETAGSGWEAMERVEAGASPHVLLLDLPGDEGDSLRVVRWLRRLRPEMPIILLSHADGAMREKQAARLGAQDFLVRPFDEQQLELAIRRQMAPANGNHHASLTSENVEHLGEDMFFIGITPAMQRLRAQAELLAQASVPVLIVGEPGTGRDTVARLIHKLSIRSEFKFLKVNCAALPTDLLERELFGLTTGPFEGEDRSSPGKLEICDKGTIFLDDIVEVSPSLQEKLLYLMQTKQFVKPGSRKSLDVDVRVLAATDGNIETVLSERVLREDLYSRLSAFTIRVPPLRQRKEEIPFLLQHFMHKLAKRFSLPPRELSPTVLEASQRYPWPGNVRELENFVKGYLMLGDLTMGWSESGDATETTNVSAAASSKYESADTAPTPKSLKSLITDVKCEAERNAIAAALERTGWNRKAAARLLKVSYRTILYKIERYDMHSREMYSSPFMSHGSANGLKGNGKRI
jgi:two-component system, NtrC family, response regulator AtoC